VWDVATGYRAAIAKLVGEGNIKDYFLDRHVAYHRNALPQHVASDDYVLSRYASESVVTEALYFDADVVFIVSGLNFHALTLDLLRKIKLPTAVLFTESPYEDESQSTWAANYPDMVVFTNDQSSAEKFGWQYVPHSYNPDVHYPRNVDTTCDVVMVGTGWPERQAFLEHVNWDEIDLRLYGIWPTMKPDSPLRPFLMPRLVDNKRISELYCGAKICLNFHRDSGTHHAYSLGPRAFEIAASGAFQLSDHRDELVDVFGASVPVFRTVEELGDLIRHFLEHDDERRRLAEYSRERVRKCTFDDRAAKIVKELSVVVTQEINVNA